MKGLFSSYLPVMLILVGGAGCQTQGPSIFTVTDEKGTVQTKGPEVKGTIHVRVMIDSLVQEKNVSVDIPVPGDKQLKLVRKRLDVHDKGRFAWYGIIRDDPGSFALISVTSKALAGKITTSRGEVYMISYAGKGIHDIDLIDESSLPERKDDDIEAPAQQGGEEKERDCPDPATQVDIMVMYTADAETGAGGPEGMEAFIYECIYFTNLSYQNSNVNLTMHLVHFGPVTYTETGDEDIDLDRLRATADGFMDNVHALRDAHGADLVSLITETMGGCGLAFRQYPVTAGWASNAFSVVKRTCAAAGLSFAHETSHNMGARHDCANASNLPDPNHGHFVSAPADGSGSSWRTVLSYSSCTGGPCTRIPFFSNPNLSYSPTAAAATDPLGTFSAAGVCTDDNTTVLNAARSIVANFRCSSPGAANVWMRDTWNDTGLEPDPATAAESMWRSPYIWVRNSAQDPTFQHQHEHENPKMGISNWIYVKMHNGGASASGNLEIYYAQASVSLTWPGAWTLLTSIPLTVNAASTLITEIPWNSLPGEGHYCMLARWNSAADPMHSAETSDINHNTRENNNIVWRNLNIEAMDPDADEQQAIFFMQHPERKPFSLHFKDEYLWPKQAFTASGQVFVRLDDEIFSAWRKSGAKGSGIKVTDNEIQIIAPEAALHNLMLTSEKKGKGTIRFVKSKETKSDIYHFSVLQGNESGEQVTGGITYDIYAAYRQ